MAFTDLAPAGVLGWLQLLFGTTVLLLPGLAAAARVAPRWRLRWVLAPVLSLTILMLTAILGGFFLDLPLTPAVTLTSAVAWAAILQRRRLRRWMRRILAMPQRDDEDDEEDEDVQGAGPPSVPVLASAGGPGTRSPVVAGDRVTRREWLALAGAMALLILIHSMPHLPGPPNQPLAPDNAWAAPPALLGRAWGALTTGSDFPYPIHADEHIHIARAAAADREATPFAGDPYTGAPGNAGLFDLQGEVHERGFWVTLAQLHQATGLSFSAIARFLPALWGAYVGLLVWALMRPAPGAVLSACFVAILPTTALFMGIGYLVPIAFGLPWILATVAVCLHAGGLTRVLLPFALITAAFFTHLVAGGLCILAGVLACIVRPGRWTQRLTGSVLLLLPLAWTWPAIREEVRLNLTATELPPTPEAITAAGWLTLALAAFGAILAFARWRAPLAAHRALAATGAVLLSTMLLALANGHTSLALYFRPLHMYLVCAAALAGFGLGSIAVGAKVVLRRLSLAASGAARRALPMVVGGLVAMAGLGFALPVTVQSHMADGHYRIYDAESWADLAALDAAGPARGDIFLADPWRAPLMNAATGALPHTVLYPGGGPFNGGDFEHYENSAGAEPAWFAERDITWVVATAPPNATIVAQPGPRVFHIDPA